MKGYSQYKVLGLSIRPNTIITIIAAYIGVVKPTIITTGYIWPVVLTLTSWVMFDIKMFVRLSNKMRLNCSIFIYLRQNKRYMYYDWNKFKITNKLRYDKSQLDTYHQGICMAYQIEGVIVVNTDVDIITSKILKRMKKWTKKRIIEYPGETFVKIIKKQPKDLKELTVFLI